MLPFFNPESVFRFFFPTRNGREHASSAVYTIFFSFIGSPSKYFPSSEFCTYKLKKFFQLYVYFQEVCAREAGDCRVSAHIKQWYNSTGIDCWKHFCRKNDLFLSLLLKFGLSSTFARKEKKEKSAYDRFDSLKLHFRIGRYRAPFSPHHLRCAFAIKR